MAARASGTSAAPVVFGVSTEHGAVHAVALSGAGERLPERVLAQCTVAIDGDRRAAPAAVIAALDRLAAELRREPAGVAIAYHDPAERRALGIGLAAGRWRAASLVSTRAAHLNVAGAMTWLAEFDDLLLCDVVPGHLTLTLVDRDRGRVLAGVTRTGGVTSDALGAAVTAARDQLDAAETRPDAVVLIGSAAAEPAVAEAVRALGAPVLPCTVAAIAPALGAALAVCAEPGGVAEPPVPRSRSMRTAALLGAAALAAGFTVAGGAYLMSDARPVPTPPTAAAAAPVAPAASAHVPAALHHIAAVGVLERAESVPQRQAVWSPAVAQSRTYEPLPLVPAELAPGPAPAPAGSLACPPPAGAVTAAGPSPSACAPEPAVPGTGVPAPDDRVGAPDAALLFPGEAPAPAPFTPESAAWWGNHVRLTVAWATQQLLPG
ncbi:hypothetical protein [Nocardia asteroides]|uniref:hypothetical protein n=1 Tax=Nocardia asteroides TaxID=1824 RepID=UPI001E6015DC|nr:hypothetical protein [Nocardia asteroides]UGT60358.1 hypothetical protein LTT61_24645 [Nocardia asteroides]